VSKANVLVVDPSFGDEHATIKTALAEITNAIFIFVLFINLVLLFNLVLINDTQILPWMIANHLSANIYIFIL